MKYSTHALILGGRALLALAACDDASMGAVALTRLADGTVQEVSFTGDESYR
jgi:hypothetical protein